MQQQLDEASPPSATKQPLERLAPRVPPVTAAAAAARGPGKKKLKWRTRDSQSSQLYNLQLDLHDLRQEIKSLQDYEQVLRAQTLNRREALDDHYVKVVMQYHKVFEHGYDPLSTATSERRLSAADAVAFVQQMMSGGVAVGRFVGCDVILDQWQRYTMAFSGLECHLVNSQVASVGEMLIVSASADYSFEITQATIEVLFPGAVREYPMLMAKLLGRQFQCMGESTFTFDPQSHRVVCFDNQLDFLKAFASLLQDSHELHLLFKGTTISEEYFIGDTSNYALRQLGDDEEHEEYRASIGGADDEERHPSHAVSQKLQLGHILDATGHNG
ncbi:hypothetical protein BBJ28_00006901 [Nothophytophthora sp. Chile5]|nr:hypothetical protein BBJ28_00006901 [Nothophytophthora sp. Chile5]